MEKKKWKHKITSGVTGVILSFILLTVFGGLTYWFYISQNSAIIMGRILVVFAGLAFALALYRAIFFKVLIDKDGFYFQTSPGNGRYFDYSQIRRMWLSSGKETSSNQTTYCNFETNDGKILRFFFMGVDIDAVHYLKRRVEATKTISSDQLKDEAGEYIISGKVQGVQRIAVVVFVFAIIIYLAKSLAGQGLPPLTYMLPVVLVPIAIVWVVVNYLFFEIRIQKEGFYCRTNPFNGGYFDYSDIVDCKLIEERRKFGSAFRPGVRETRYFYFLMFIDANGKEHKILYNKALFEKEINILVYRIEQAQGKEFDNEEK